MVQANIGHGNVFFQQGAVAAPLGKPLAMHQRVVCQVQDVI
jgi:hypothetical protein